MKVLSYLAAFAIALSLVISGGVALAQTTTTNDSNVWMTGTNNTMGTTSTAGTIDTTNTTGLPDTGFGDIAPASYAWLAIGLILLVGGPLLFWNRGRHQI